MTHFAFGINALDFVTLNIKIVKSNDKDTFLDIKIDK